jgi:hypothetical protein
MGSAILDASRRESDEPVGEVDLRPLQRANLFPALTSQHQKADYVPEVTDWKVAPDLRKLLVREDAVS